MLHIMIGSENGQEHCVPTHPRAKKPRNATFWWSDFSWSGGKLCINKTGIRLEISGALFQELFNWVLYLALLYFVAAWVTVAGRHKKTLWFGPDEPRPWYLMRGVAMWSGITLADSVDTADAAVYFDDSTVGSPPLVTITPHFNHRCTDISKSRVAEVFEDVFGYHLSVNPAEVVGKIVEKPEKNGVHGGRIVDGPMMPRKGFTYQKLIDTRGVDGKCRDLRTPCVGGNPVLVWIKLKSPEGLFSINNESAFLKAPSDIFSEDEMVKIAAFLAHMGLDWGGLDILRDRSDGRIYIVDVNKTDIGPVIALSWRDKVASMNLLSTALHNMLSA
ncbi:hypothetical protein ABI_00210 [Asticcacaulis biprosthecium C19]|uniref:ATP-grasp domain-containing protein n=1 Tax=Asticcacaulis biprosthecium C19 TaxID=715226 RepID=F4QFX8_9CAUL|nr:hypothetical protein [Asticcacaulis biprosthecium]EGF93789.1 hypothetical protein ABI_00210 [Asticcacaulis biprosthecium C19]